MSSFPEEQQETILPDISSLAQKGINNDILFTYPDGSYQIKHRTNLSSYYKFPYVEKNRFLLDMKAIDARKMLKVKEEGWHSNYIIDGQFGLQLVDHSTGQALASAGFDIWQESTGDLVSVIGQMPQGIYKHRFKTRQSKRKFLQFDFRTEMLQAVLVASRKAGVKKVIVISANNHYEIADYSGNIPIEQTEQINGKSPLSLERGLIIIDKPALSAGFKYDPKYDGNLLIDIN